MKPTAASYQPPQLSIDSKLLQKYDTELPQPTDGSQSALMANHVDVTRIAHSCITDHNSLIDSVFSQQGVTINGIAPRTLPPK